MPTDHLTAPAGGRAILCMCGYIGTPVRTERGTIECPRFIAEQVDREYVAASPNVGRNDPCPCGSGRKFKKCHSR